jgi:hypothetical protein
VRHLVVRAVPSDPRTPPFVVVALARMREPIAAHRTCPQQWLGDVALDEPLALKAARRAGRARRAASRRAASGGQAGAFGVA